MIYIDQFLLSVVQLDEHFSRPMKEFVSLCLKKLPAEVIILCPRNALLLCLSYYCYLISYIGILLIRVSAFTP